MPLGGLIPYDDEEERRRRRLPNPVADLAMGELEAARPRPALPDPLTSSPSPLPATTNPGALPAPVLKRPTRYEEMTEAKDAYLEKTPGRLKSGLLGAARGFLGGGGLAGAIVGGASGAIDPRGLREQEFNQRIRPQIAERFGMEDAERAGQAAAEDRQLGNAYKTAQIGEINRRGIPEPPKTLGYGDAPGVGIYNRDTGQVTTPAAPKTPEPRLITFEGRTYDYSNPAQRADLEKAQSRVPRDKSGRFITRADERASAKGGGGGESAKSGKAMQKAVESFNNTKRALQEAVGRGDDRTARDLRKRLGLMVADMSGKYGDQLELGGGDWPYVKPRGATQQAPAAKQEGRQQPKRSRAESYKILRNGGFNDADANKELDRLGIK